MSGYDPEKGQYSISTSALEMGKLLNSHVIPSAEICMTQSQSTEKGVLLLNIINFVPTPSIMRHLFISYAFPLQLTVRIFSLGWITSSRLDLSRVLVYQSERHRIGYKCGCVLPLEKAAMKIKWILEIGRREASSPARIVSLNHHSLSLSNFHFLIFLLQIIDYIHSLWCLWEIPTLFCRLK